MHLEGFHIRAAYRMAKMNKPKRGSGRVWIYPQSVDVLPGVWDENMQEYIIIQWQMITVYVATCPILNKCRLGKQKRGVVPCLWRWDQPMDLDVNDTFGLDK